MRGHTYLGPILVSTCGLLQSSLGVYKSLMGRVKAVKLTSEDVSKNTASVSFIEQKTPEVEPEEPRARILSNTAEDFIRKQGI